MATTLIVSRALEDTGTARRLEDELARLAADAGAQVLVTPDIYHIAHDSGLWDEIAALDGRVGVAAWHYPRPAEWMLRSHGLDAAELSAVDLRECARAEECWALLAEQLAPDGGEGAVRELDEPVSERWYPVVDYSRCIACGHCMQFCIFGVWERRKRRVVTVVPDNCKLGCPACARICPRGAIMFPTSDDPVLAGAPGTLMTPDAAARRMYYVRTGARCPKCGSRGEPDVIETSAGAPVCEECGRPLKSADIPPSEVRDEIDALIDELDALAEGDGP
ncbi:MAG: 4Fe-4S binding protein [Armatimonadetes bacterium]|nr:4Fe-4S binding protein [Armatimonadota bacterium]